MKEFLAEIHRFCEERAVSPTKFGELVLGDGHFVHDLGSGKRNPQAYTIWKIREYMAATRAGRPMKKRPAIKPPRST